MAAPEGLVVVFEVGSGTRTETVAQAVHDAVVREHGVEPHDVVIADRGTIPMTTSGKRRRGACLAAYRSGLLNGREREVLR